MRKIVVHVYDSRSPSLPSGLPVRRSTLARANASPEVHRAILSRALLAMCAAATTLAGCTLQADETGAPGSGAAEPISSAALEIDVSSCACFTNTDNACNYGAADRAACGVPSTGCSTTDDWQRGWYAHADACAVPRACPCITITDNACNYSSSLDRGACGVPSTGCSTTDDWQRGWYAHENACSATTFDALDFMRNTHGGTLVSGSGSIVSFKEQPDGHFYYVKGPNSPSNDGHVFERYGFDGTSIWLERDTSWPVTDGAGFDAYDAVSPETHQYGVHTWAKRAMRDGEAWSTRVQIIGFQTDAVAQRCHWSNRVVDDRNNTTGFDHSVRLVRDKAWGGDVGTVDSIAITSGAEVHWYARGWGWVSWEWNGPATPGLSTVVWNRRVSTQRLPLELCPNGPLPFQVRSISNIGAFRDGQWVLDVNGSRAYDAGDRVTWWGAPGDIPVAGSWDGSGQARTGVARINANGFMSWYLDWTGNGLDSADRAYQFGQRGDTPVVGDWTGSGQSRIGIWLNGMWVLDINGNGTFDGTGIDRVTWWGAPGDIPVVGAWDGGRESHLGVARVNSDGLMYWYLDWTGNGLDSTDRVFQFGLRGDVPVVGDWNGTGQSRIGVVRNGQWILDVNADGYDGEVPVGTYGSPGDKFVTGVF